MSYIPKFLGGLWEHLKKQKTQYLMLEATVVDTYPKCVRGKGKYHSRCEVMKVQVATKQNSRTSSGQPPQDECTLDFIC